MAKASKSWHDKLHAPTDLPKTIAVPAPLEVDALMKRIPKGKLITITELRNAIARQHGTTEGCPMTTGIFAWLAAYAADEAMQEGKKNITPYWRTLKADGELNPKYPGGITNLKKLLKSEGHSVISKGTRFFVQDYDKALFTL